MNSSHMTYTSPNMLKQVRCSADVTLSQYFMKLESLIKLMTYSIPAEH